MRILFINCVSETDFTYTIPLAPAYLASYIKGKFNEKIYVKTVSIIDRQKVLKTIKDFKPDILGLTMTTPGYDSAKFFAKEAKKINRKIIVVAGGAHITLFEKIDDKHIDYAISGEGEQVFYDLLKYLFPKISPDKSILPKEKIPGLIYWHEDKLIVNPRGPFIKNLDDVGHPDRRLLNPTNNSLFTSRGCPFNCIYCSSPVIWKRTFRMHSAEYVFEEIKTLYEHKHSVQWILVV